MGSVGNSYKMGIFLTLTLFALNQSYNKLSLFKAFNRKNISTSELVELPTGQVKVPSSSPGRIILKCDERGPGWVFLLITKHDVEQRGVAFADLGWECPRPLSGVTFKSYHTTYTKQPIALVFELNIM